MQNADGPDIDRMRKDNIQLIESKIMNVTVDVNSKYQARAESYQRKSHPPTERDQKSANDDMRAIFNTGIEQGKAEA